ncbi:NAD(+) synthase [Bovifimicola ammoniilytica]|uniref:NAD(+) synthase n=1 Tax=Bovifimicola ammoniilytica TaxID=2981720 RepID=UPI0008223AFB|nr:NAD(+) synthase [Bovifimicola ammoniilytica]MCU6752960.1 NAD(+) synthase [Bovifimicola ammoniilytica]SCJ46215.1 Glutamine-dependent NAD(+) synthetase [uncultured Eubacterium sp.]
MDYGFIKVAAATPKIKVADVDCNTELICNQIDEAAKNGAKVLVFPELCLTGYTCSDLFWQSLMLEKVKEKTIEIARYSKDYDMLIMIGIPYEHNGKLYNVGVVLHKGKVLGVVTKKHLPNYSEFYEARHFTKGFEKVVTVDFAGQKVPMGMNILFKCENRPDMVIGVEICEDLWVPNPPSIRHTMAGATIIANLSASDEVTGKSIYRRDLVAGQSARLICGYIYADAGEGESSTDLVYSAHNMIAENGRMLAEAKRFINQTVYGDIDLDRIKNERRKMTTYDSKDEEDYTVVTFEMNMDNNELSAKINNMPFVPGDIAKRNERCEEILTIQAMGLKKRLEHTNAKSAVIGISGGLDSTLALLVTVRAFDMLGRDRKGIVAVTMPGFGTTDRTYDNALKMIEKLGTTFIEINISDAANEHFKAIGHDSSIHDVTYENVQARQRTLYLMNLANQYNGFVVGTGDLSELALGWATYNGDHMSMYGVNASIPKTLVRHLVRYYADTCDDIELNKVLMDVLDTPVSPELLPTQDNGEIAQKTEDLVGPYELHDFFMYYMLRLGYTPKKIYYLARNAFEGIYDDETILKWLKTFYRRFFAQQFKRSCLPDGPKVGTVAVSPRGDLRMPSDACATIWLKELEEI